MAIPGGLAGGLMAGSAAGPTIGPLAMLSAGSSVLGSALGAGRTKVSEATASSDGYAMMNSPFIVGGGGGVATQTADTVRSLAPWLAVAVVAVVFLRMR